MAHPEIGAVGAQFLDRDGELDRLQEGVGGRAGLRLGEGVQWPKVRKPMCFMGVCVVSSKALVDKSRWLG